MSAVYFFFRKGTSNQNFKMASKGKKGKKYTADHKVDEWLLNQVVKHVNHGKVGSLARDLFVEESVYFNITQDMEKTFKVRDLWWASHT